MIKIELKKASNGIIKKIVDDNYDGAGTFFEDTLVYPLGNNDNYKSEIKFINDIIKDMAITTGNNYDKNMLHFKFDWGPLYKPNKEEISEKIKTLEEKLSLLKKYNYNDKI